MITSGQTVVVSAGTPVQLYDADDLHNVEVVIKALPANTGRIYIGSEDEIESSGLADTGYIIWSGGELHLSYVDSMDDVWIDSSVSQEGVSYICI